MKTQTPKANPLNRADINTALGAVKAMYGQLVHDGIGPATVVIAMSEIIAYSLAHKAATGGGQDATLRSWLIPFEKSYRKHFSEATTTGSSA